MTFNTGKKILIKRKKPYTDGARRGVLLETYTATITKNFNGLVEYIIDEVNEVQNPPSFYKSPVGQSGAFQEEYADLLNITKK